MKRLKKSTQFSKFLWNDKGDKIKRKIMINDYSEGGLKRIDIGSFHKSLKATWIQKYLDPESRSEWKVLFDSELQINGGKAILKGNLHKKGFNNLKISDLFVKKILVIWAEGFFFPGNDSIWRTSFVVTFVADKNSE